MLKVILIGSDPQLDVSNKAKRFDVTDLFNLFLSLR